MSFFCPQKSTDIVIAVLLNRILEPRIDKDELNVQEIYRAMDLLYDITSVFFEGRGKDYLYILTS